MEKSGSTLRKFWISWFEMGGKTRNCRFKLQFVDSLVKRVSRSRAHTCDAARWGNLRYNLGGSLYSSDDMLRGARR